MGLGLLAYVAPLPEHLPPRLVLLDPSERAPSVTAENTGSLTTRAMVNPGRSFFSPPTIGLAARTDSKKKSADRW